MRVLSLILLLIPSFCVPMETPPDESLTAHEQEELSKIVVSFYFSRISPKVREKIYPRIKESVDVLARSDTDDTRKIKRELCHLRDAIRAKKPLAAPMIEPTDVHGQYAHLHAYISSMVGLAIEDSFADIEEQIHILKEENRKKERHKRLAMLAGVVSTALTTAATLIVHFTGN